MGLDTDGLRSALEATVLDGIGDLVGEVNDELRTEVTDMANNAAAAAINGDEATLKEIAAQTLVTGEIGRQLANAELRAKAGVVMRTAFKFALAALI
jgi:hypothetical protein